jgi:NAD(P)-dependent dehydrogenase (short-subunit alcohol dehydrogenase family)
LTLHVVILGALSAVAEEIARLYASEGAALMLVGRGAERLQAVAADLGVRGASAVHIDDRDLTRTEDAAAAVEDWTRRLGGFDHVLLAYGVLGDQAAAEQDPAEAVRALNVNFVSAAAWCLAAANALEARKAGSLVVLGSVAGDRGRQSNFIYGAAKGGLAILVQGLAHRLAKSGVRAVIVKPGFIDTPMTAHLPKGGPLWSSPAQIARLVRRAADKGGPIAYAPGYWRLILTAVRATPAFVFHKTKL